MNKQSKNIRTHHKMGRTKKPLWERDKIKAKYEVPHEIKTRRESNRNK